MHAPASFDYAILRVVPRVEREAFINAGVIVFCPEKDYLAVRIRLDGERLKALWPELDADLVANHLEAIRRICEGDAAGGAIAQLSRRERFHWLVAPRSTVIQVSPVHSGMTAVPEQTLDELFRRLVAYNLPSSADGP